MWGAGVPGIEWVSLEGDQAQKGDWHRGQVQSSLGGGGSLTAALGLQKAKGTYLWKKGAIVAAKLTCPQIEPHSAEEIVGCESVVIPDSQFYGALPQVIQADVLEDECVVPLRIHIAPHNWSFLFGASGLLGQQVTEDRKQYLFTKQLGNKSEISDESFCFTQRSYLERTPRTFQKIRNLSQKDKCYCFPDVSKNVQIWVDDTYPLQNGSDVPFDLTAVKFLASLIRTCSSPLDLLPLFIFLLVMLSDVTNLSKIMRSPLYVMRATELEF